MRAGAAIAIVAVLAAGALLLLGGDDGPEPIARADAYAAAWARGDDAAAARLTDAPGRARQALVLSRDGLEGGDVRAGVVAVTENEDGTRARAELTVEWRVPGFGPYAYETTIELRPRGDAWVVHWTPQALHPQLDSETRLGTQVDLPDRAPILDRRGRRLVGQRVARAVVGTVGPITAEQLEDDDRDLAPGALVGQSGLAAAHDEQLAGAPKRSVVIRDRILGDATEFLDSRGGRAPRPLRTTLDIDVQRAAERAMSGLDSNGALVAVQPSSGDILAVANRPADSTFDRGLSGTYPPGSTFKVVSTAALLRSGLNVSRTVNCPATITVGGRSFRNFEGSAAGAVPFATDFVQSCNSAFISLAGRLGPDALTRVGRQFGLGREINPGVNAATSSVPRPRDAAAQAAMMIGQDRILASPLAMAGVAATVAEGRWRAPRLLERAPRAKGPRLQRRVRRTLRTLMRSVITRGTGTALAGIGGRPAGKSGTAEFGSGDPPPTHAWFIAYRRDVAIAVIVEGGASGGRVAAPRAAAFFRAL